MEVLIILLIVILAAALYPSYEAYKKRERDREDLEERQRDTRAYESRLQEALKREIENLINTIIADWNSAVYNDKIGTPGGGTVIYKFENGSEIHYRGDTLKYTNRNHSVQYKMNLEFRSRFTGIFGRMIDIINNGQAGRRTSRRYYTPPRPSPGPVTGKSRKYTVLTETIKLRKENLAKMRKDHPDRQVMENELRAAERVAASMQQKH